MVALMYMFQHHSDDTVQGYAGVDFEYTISFGRGLAVPGSFPALAVCHQRACCQWFGVENNQADPREVRGPRHPQLRQAEGRRGNGDRGPVFFLFGIWQVEICLIWSNKLLWTLIWRYQGVWTRFLSVWTRLF